MVDLRTPRKRSRQFSKNLEERSRSPSPSYGQSAKKRARSRSPYRHQAKQNRKTHDARRSARPRYRRGDREEVDMGTGFFQGADSQATSRVCAACLGRHDHDFTKCNLSKLWDGSELKEKAHRNNQGRLVGKDGSMLCFDWQLPGGCQSTSHPERHRCSGCAKSEHGAQNCPRAEKI